MTHGDKGERSSKVDGRQLDVRTCKLPATVKDYIIAIRMMDTGSALLRYAIGIIKSNIFYDMQQSAEWADRPDREE